MEAMGSEGQINEGITVSRKGVFEEAVIGLIVSSWFNTLDCSM